MESNNGKLYNMLLDKMDFLKITKSRSYPLVSTLVTSLVSYLQINLLNVRFQLQ